MEIWKDIKNYENHYQVSNLGRVKSLKHNKKNYNLGTYNTAIEAFNEYNNALSQLDIDFIGYYKILKCKNKSKPYCKRTIKNKYDNKHVYSNGFII